MGGASSPFFLCLQITYKPLLDVDRLKRLTNPVSGGHGATVASAVPQSDVLGVIGAPVVLVGVAIDLSLALAIPESAKVNNIPGGVNNGVVSPLGGIRPKPLHGFDLFFEVFFQVIVQLIKSLFNTLIELIPIDLNSHIFVSQLDFSLS